MDAIFEELFQFEGQRSFQFFKSGLASSILKFPPYLRLMKANEQFFMRFKKKFYVPPFKSIHHFLMRAGKIQKNFLNSKG